MKDVVNDYFGSSYKNVVSFFVDEKKLNADDLKKMIEIIEKGKKMNSLLIISAQGIGKDYPVLPLLSPVFQQGYLLSQEPGASDPFLACAGYTSVCEVSRSGKRGCKC
ncbi:MAG: BlaI/MecI/CopY family transcriptional regulator [Sphingobacterium sp.]|nr:BlaI/MecI/CopY family transcriptional regulator [Sphingobacterium sp.]